MAGRENIEGAINRMEEIVKGGKLRVKRKKLKAQVLKPAKEGIPNYERERVCGKASKAAKSEASKVRRKISKEVRQDLEL